MVGSNFMLKEVNTHDLKNFGSVTDMTTTLPVIYAKDPLRCQFTSVYYFSSKTNKRKYLQNVDYVIFLYIMKWSILRRYASTDNIIFFVYIYGVK